MNIYDRFSADVERYLTSKLPELPASTQMEISEYISNRISRLVNDAYAEHEDRMNKRIDSYRRRFERSEPEGDS